MQFAINSENAKDVYKTCTTLGKMRQFLNTV